MHLFVLAILQEQMLSAWHPSHHVHKYLGGTLKNWLGVRARRGCDKHVKKPERHLWGFESSCLPSILCLLEDPVSVCSYEMIYIPSVC